MKAIIIEARRDCYSKEEAAGDTITAGELIRILSMYDEDTKVILSHDGGYTYGAINDERISEPESLGEEPPRIMFAQDFL